MHPELEREMEKIYPHTVTMARVPTGCPRKDENNWREIRGSGTLCKFQRQDGWMYGILTAGHVITALLERTTNTVPDEIYLLTESENTGFSPSSATPPALFRIPCTNYHVLAKGLRNTKREGPDVAFLILDPETAASIEETKGSRGVFYNLSAGLSRAMEYGSHTSMEDPPSNDSKETLVACGWPAELQERSDGKTGCMLAVEITGYRRFEEKDGWHFRDFMISDKDGNMQNLQSGETAPSKWGGLSGGGLWHITAQTNEDGQTATSKQLEGVVYYHDIQAGTNRSFVTAQLLPSIIRLITGQTTPPEVGTVPAYL